MSNAIRHHYVWRQYLRNFCSDSEKIFVLRNGESIFETNLMNIGQEKYFYELSDLKTTEIRFLEDYTRIELKNYPLEVLEYFLLILEKAKIILDSYKADLKLKTNDEIKKNYQSVFLKIICVSMKTGV